MTTSGAFSITWIKADWPKTRLSFTPRIRASSSASTIFSTNGLCTKNRCGCRSSFAGLSRSRPGAVNKEMILNVDFAPMMLDAAGVKVPADMQGRSFLPLLRGETPAGWRTSMYYRYYHPGHHNVAAHYGIRTERYKLIYFNKLNQWELYDLQRDPAEMRNLYAETASASIVTKLKEELYRLKKELKDNDQFADALPKDDVDSQTPPAAGTR